MSAYDTELLESALIIVIGNKIIKPKIKPITVSSSEPEIIYEYKGFNIPYIFLIPI